MSSHKMRIAVIDDEEIYRLFIGKEMSELSFYSKTFSCFDDFLEVIEGEDRDPFDLVIVDRLVGDEDAVRDRFVESCRNYGFNGAIILYSNYISSSEGSESFEGVLRKGDLVNWEKEIIDAINKRSSRM